MEEDAGYGLNGEQQMVCCFPAIRDTTVPAVAICDINEGKEPIPEEELIAAMETIVPPR